jgi:hypothetical protein
MRTWEDLDATGCPPEPRKKLPKIRSGVHSGTMGTRGAHGARIYAHKRCTCGFFTKNIPCDVCTLEKNKKN